MDNNDYDDFENSEEYKNTFVYSVRSFNSAFTNLVETIKYEFSSCLRKIIYDTTYFNSIGYVYKRNRFTGRKTLRKLSALERVGVSFSPELEQQIKDLVDGSIKLTTTIENPFKPLPIEAIEKLNSIPKENMSLIEAQKLICEALNPPFFPEEEIK
jgi:hypothetical protein